MDDDFDTYRPTWQETAAAHFALIGGPIIGLIGGGLLLLALLSHFHCGVK